MALLFEKNNNFLFPFMFNVYINIYSQKLFFFKNTWIFKFINTKKYYFTFLLDLLKTRETKND